MPALSDRTFRPHLDALEDRLLLTVLGTDNRILVTNTTAYPFRTVGHLITRWANGTTTVGSGAMIGARHFLTAGHCVYDASRGGWAVSHQIILGQNGTATPYGSVYATYQRTFSGWTSNRSPNADMALLTLGTSIGNSTGWFGMQVQSDSWFASRPTINSAGYPADIGGNTHMYRISGPVTSYSAERLYYNGTMDTFGGQSGSPLWRYNASTGQRHIIGVHTSGYSTYNGGTRLTLGKFNSIVGWMNTDNTARSAGFLAQVSSTGLTSQALPVNRTSTTVSTTTVRSSETGMIGLMTGADRFQSALATAGGTFSISTDVMSSSKDARSQGDDVGGFQQQVGGMVMAGNDGAALRSVTASPAASQLTDTLFADPAASFARRSELVLN